MVAVFLLAAFSTGAAIAEETMPSDPGHVPSRPRIRVDPNNSTEIAIRQCLISAVEAANAEDLDGFVDCFTGGVQAKIRRPAAMRFVQHDVSMELVDSHIIKSGKTTGEVAVRYRVLLSDDRFDVVSLVVVKQEHGYWRINSEKIQSYEHQSPSMCSPSRYACLGATCRVAAR
jgi:hypothetical protein